MLSSVAPSRPYVPAWQPITSLRKGSLLLLRLLLLLPICKVIEVIVGQVKTLFLIKVICEVRYELGLSVDTYLAKVTLLLPSVGPLLGEMLSIVVIVTWSGVFFHNGSGHSFVFVSWLLEQHWFIEFFGLLLLDQRRFLDER